METARDVTAAERRRRTVWEDEQQAKSTQIERRMVDMQQELSLLKAFISVHPNMAVPAEILQVQNQVETIPTMAHIEPLSPITPLSPLSIESLPSEQQSMFVQGSSTSPSITSQASYLALSNPPASYPPVSYLVPDSNPQAVYPHWAAFSDFSTLSPAETPSPLHSPAQVSVPAVGTPTSQSTQPSPTPVSSSPSPGPNSLKRPHQCKEDDSDYDSDSEDSDSPTTDRPLKRKNGHDQRCLTIHVRYRWVAAFIPMRSQCFTIERRAYSYSQAHEAWDRGTPSRRPL